MGLTIAQLSARLRCAECVGQLHSVKPWRLDDVLGKPLGRRVDYSPSSFRRPPWKAANNAECMKYMDAAQHCFSSE